MGDASGSPHRETSRNPWRKLAWGALTIGALACFAWIVYAWDEQGREVNSFLKVPPMSDLPIEIPKAGTYTVWATAASQGYREVPPKSEMYELMILGFDGPVDSADPVRVDPVPFPGSERYRVDGTRYGVAMWTVDFPEAGTYITERRNLGVGSVGLALGEGVGMPSHIVEGVIVIVAITVVVVAGFMILAWARDRREMRAMLSSFDTFGRS